MCLHIYGGPHKSIGRLAWWCTPETSALGGAWRGSGRISRSSRAAQRAQGQPGPQKPHLSQIKQIKTTFDRN